MARIRRTAAATATTMAEVVISPHQSIEYCSIYVYTSSDSDMVFSMLVLVCVCFISSWLSGYVAVTCHGSFFLLCCSNYNLFSLHCFGRLTCVFFS
jgi:hypothetical protein